MTVQRTVIGSGYTNMKLTRNEWRLLRVIIQMADENIRHIAHYAPEDWVVKNAIKDVEDAFVLLNEAEVE